MHDPIRPGQLELGPGLALAATRSRTSEAELGQEAVRWDAEEGRYLPEGEDGGERTAVPTSTAGSSSQATLSHPYEKHASTPPARTNTWSASAGPAREKAQPADPAAEPHAGADGEPLWVEWDEEDPENPYNWSRRRKWVTTIVVCSNCALCNWTGAAFGLGSASMRSELGMGRELAALGLAA